MNIFKDKSKMPAEAGARQPEFMPAFEPSAKPDVVRTMMTPADERALRMSNYPGYDWMDVENRPVRNRGHHY